MDNRLISFDQIDEHGPQSDRGTFEVPIAELDRLELASIGPLSIEVTVDKGDEPGAYVADGTVSFMADYNCSRCLEPYPIAASSGFHVTFKPRPSVSKDHEEVEITESGELDVEFYSEREIPLRDLAIEQVQLSIPMKPLCEEGCLGLCPQCGANRNREGCNCEATLTDERWGALQEIREQLSKKRDV